ncbi:MAG: glycosyltransferase [Sulfuricurvum sp.]|uniref:glycosyltransferase n=1 Tax=Sulfuricurvum sp. TaxID=2025608 RepID=UPI0026146765|nr:glycosyltransferase [Sulfuricurvum sp.]MDD2367676.1 glycosyltransferase [Sulfuricurvum sp.]MDD5118601.1 glycosyltransferase [Sulfuricurvum sp.]
MKKQKVLFFLPQMAGGGAEKVTINIMKLLDKKYFEVYLVTLSDKGPAMANVPKDIHIHILDVKKTLFSFFKLRKKITEINPDIVFSSLFRGNIALVVALTWSKLKPYIILRSPNSPKLLIANNELSRIMKYLIEFTYTKCDQIIAQTPEMREEIINFHGINPDKIKVLLNPIDQQDIDNKTVNSVSPYDSENINVIAAGRLHHQKGFDILIESFAHVITKNPNFKLFIIGEDVSGERISLEQKVKDLNLENHITFLGYQSNPYPYFKFADVYVLSSRWEGLPNTVLESLYLNTPVISTKCIPFLSKLIHDGDNGYLVEVEDIHGLSNVILKTKEIKRIFSSTVDSKKELNEIFTN